MRNFYRPGKFPALTIHFSEVWPRWSLLQTTIFAVRLVNTLNTSQKLVYKNSLTWWYIFKTSWRCLQDVFARRLEDVLEASWRCLGKTFWKCLEEVWKMYGQNEYIGLNQDALKTSSEEVWLIRIYSSSSGRLEDVFIKKNVCGDLFQYYE